MAIIEAEFMELTTGLDTGAFWEEDEACREYTTHKPRGCVIHIYELESQRQRIVISA